MHDIIEILDITKKAVTIAEELEKFISDALQIDNGLKSLLSREMSVYDGLIPSDALSFNELAQNNYEYLDFLNAITLRILQHTDKQALRKRAKLTAFNDEINRLIAELNIPLSLQYNVNRRNVTGTRKFNETAEDVPVPIKIMFKKEKAIVLAVSKEGLLTLDDHPTNDKIVINFSTPKHQDLELKQLLKHLKEGDRIKILYDPKILKS
jgi:hypothetical protein